MITQQARHVTSVRMQGSAVHARKQQVRWREAEPDERGEFSITLRQLVQSGAAQPVQPPVLQL